MYSEMVAAPQMVTNVPIVSALRGTLLSWYDQNKRDLPWRKTRDPYRIWISEIMLQQTRVAAVLPRYESFLKRFPSVEKLAMARANSVLAQWSGLGYYRRARNLHAAAKLIARRTDRFPKTSDEWRELPGIGRYTAAAIASIAFDEPVAVVDGNVKRVLGRLSGSTDADPWKAAQNLLDPARPGDFNQAMMEIGATVCLAPNPKCEECPLHTFCRTRGRGERSAHSVRQHKRRATYALSCKSSEVFLVRRPANLSLMPGMWELPEVESPTASDEPLFSVRHSITITDFDVRVVSRRSGRKIQEREGSWIHVSRLQRLPLTGLTAKILRKAKII